MKRKRTTNSQEAGPSTKKVELSSKESNEEEEFCATAEENGEHNDTADTVEMEGNGAEDDQEEEEDEEVDHDMSGSQSFAEESPSPSQLCGSMEALSEDEDEDGDGEFEEDKQEARQNGWRLIAGTIERVRLRNFMCHAEFEYKPSPKLNFLSGANGSGKSAVLAAIVFALGGSAKLTNRGSANRNFIRTGENSASVEVTLVNRGENAYKPRVYGKSLTIVRTVQAGGGGAYKLKNELGKIVTSRRVREELGHILYNFNIQVENPIALLNQDAAKTFLFKCDPSNLYKFFMRATQLEDCHENYRIATEEKNKADTTMGIKKRHMEEMSKEVEVWKKKYQFHQSMKTKKKEVEELRAKCNWAMVYQLGDSQKEVEEDVAKIEKKLFTGKTKLEEIADNSVAMKHRKEEIEAEIQKIAAEATDQENSLIQVKARLKQLRLEEKAFEREKLTIHQNSKDVRNQLKSVEAAIKEIRDKDDNDYKKASEKRQAQIAKLTEEIEAQESRYKTTQAHIGNIEHSLSSCREEEQEINSRMRAAQIDLQNHKRNLKAVQSQGNNKLVIFGENMPQFVNEIAKNKDKFSRPPIGPIGMKIQLKPGVSKAEAELIETEIGPLLSAFIVNNFNDRRLLVRMAKSYKIDLTTVTRRFRDDKYDVREGLARAEGGRSILEMLLIDDPNVFNVLVDQKKVEQVLIVREDARAQDLMKTANMVPKNCAHILTPEFNQYFPAPMYRSYAINRKRGGAVLQTSITEHVKNLKSEIEAGQKALEEITAEMEAHQQQRGQHASELKNNKAVCQTIRSALSNLSNQKKTLEREENDDKPIDVAALEEDQEKLQEKIATFDASIQSKENEKQAVTEQVVEVERELKQLQHDIGERKRTAEPLTEELSSIEKNVADRELHRRKIQVKLQTLEKEKVVKEKELAELQEGIDKFKAEGKEFCEEMPRPNRSFEKLRKDLKALKENIAAQEAVYESKEVCDRTYREKNKEFRAVARQIRSLDNTVKYLEEMLIRRKQGYTDIRVHMSHMVNIKLGMRLSARKFAGKAKFNHRHRTLELNIHPEGEDAVEARSMKSLSGGEKSYSTVSLVLSLWDVIQPPFRILDEFDVFMDMVNRRIALDQIIEYVRETKAYQYIMLTPLSMESVDANDELISILYLKKNAG